MTSRIIGNLADGYTYTGDESTYHVRMIKRDTRKGTATITLERLISGPGTIPIGATITVPLRRIS